VRGNTTHGVFRGAEGGGDRDVCEDWSTPLLLEETQDEFRGINRRASSNGDNRVCVEVFQDLQTSLDTRDRTVLPDLGKGRPVNMPFLQQPLDV